ncbi:MAG: hypothetical protein AAGH64_01780 [Planctomycetota bacterium]
MSAPRTAAIALATIASGVALAQFAIERETTDNGGTTLTGATFTLSGTVAQPDANPALAGATFTLRGGFWPRPAPTPINTCPADFDNDGDVDLGDFGIFGGAFGATSGDPNYNPSADFDSDHDTDLGDFGVFGTQFGRTDCLD